MTRRFCACEVCGSRWDGGFYTEYPALRICSWCNHLAAIQLADLMGDEFILTVLRSPNQHLISMLCLDNAYPTRHGSVYSGTGESYTHVSNLDDKAPGPALPSADDSFGPIPHARDTGFDSPGGQGIQTDSFFEELAVQAATRNEE